MEIWARVRGAVGWVAGAIAAVVAAVTGILVLRRRGSSAAVAPVDEAAGRRIESANARAAGQIATAEQDEVDVAVELGEIAEDEDGERRRRRLIESVKRIETEGEKKR